MKYDTAGNKIDELISNCDCGLTGGCLECNPLSSFIGCIFKKRNKIFFSQEEFISKETEERFYKKVFNK